MTDMEATIKRRTKEQQLTKAQIERALVHCNPAAEKFVLEAMLGSDAASKAVIARVVAEDFALVDGRKLFEVLKVRAGGNLTTEEDKTAADMQRQLIGSLTASGKPDAKPEDIVRACDSMRETRRRRMILKASEELYIDGMADDWLARAEKNILEIKSLPAIEPARKREGNGNKHQAGAAGPERATADRQAAGKPAS